MTPDQPGNAKPSPAAQGISQGSFWGMIGGVVFLGLLLLLIGLNHSTERPQRLAGGVPPHPAGVPPEAVFCHGVEGGYFVALKRDDLILADGRKLPAFQIGAWHGRTGAAEFIGTGIFVSDPVVATADGRDAVPLREAEILKSAYFTGRELHFDMDDHGAVGRIIPLTVALEGQ